MTERRCVQVRPPAQTVVKVTPPSRKIVPRLPLEHRRVIRTQTGVQGPPGEPGAPGDSPDLGFVDGGTP